MSRGAECDPLHRHRPIGNQRVISRNKLRHVHQHCRLSRFSCQRTDLFSNFFSGHVASLHCAGNRRKSINRNFSVPSRPAREGPVAVSTPEVQPYSGWRVQRLPACRKRLRHGQPQARSGRDSAIRGRMDRSEESAARGNMLWVPRPSVFRGDRSLTAAPHRSTRCEAYWYKAGLIAFAGSWHGSSGASYYACLKKICPFKLLISRSCVRRLQARPIAILYMKVL